MTFLLHHQVYNPADVIWDAEDWADFTESSETIGEQWQAREILEALGFDVPGDY